MGESGKVSGRGGWKTTHYLYGEKRELNKREQTAYERYCAYCELLGCRPASEHIWFVVSQSISSH